MSDRTRFLDLVGDDGSPQELEQLRPRARPPGRRPALRRSSPPASRRRRGRRRDSRSGSPAAPPARRPRSCSPPRRGGSVRHRLPRRRPRHGDFTAKGLRCNAPAAAPHARARLDPGRRSRRGRQLAAARPVGGLKPLPKGAVVRALPDPEREDRPPGAATSGQEAGRTIGALLGAVLAQGRRLGGHDAARGAPTSRSLLRRTRYGAVRSFATNAACVTGMRSAKNCSTASA